MAVKYGHFVSAAETTALAQFDAAACTAAANFLVEFIKIVNAPLVNNEKNHALLVPFLGNLASVSMLAIRGIGIHIGDALAGHGVNLGVHAVVQEDAAFGVGANTRLVLSSDTLPAHLFWSLLAVEYYHGLPAALSKDIKVSLMQR